MKAVLENKLSMYVSVNSNLDQFQNVWQGVPAFVTAVAALRTRIDAINSLEQSRNGGSKGATTMKQAARQAMAIAALEVAGAVRAFAAATGDAELEARVSFTSSDILHGRDTEAKTICQGIHDDANANVAALANYGVVANDLTALQAKINAYNVVLGKPRAAINNDSSAVEQLEAEFDATDRLLEGQVDGMAETFRSSQSAFYNAYSASRRIVDNASGHPAPAPNNQPQPQPV
jgi:hypothetical protein